MTTKTITFAESTSISRSQTVNLPNLKAVTNVTVNTGNVTYSVSGNDITVNVSNGAYTRYTTDSYTPSMNATDWRTGAYSTSASYPATVPYNNGGYTGTLNQSGSPYYVSGSAPVSATKTGTQNCTITWKWAWDGDFWSTDGYTDNAPSTMPYNDGAYSGTLNKVSTSGTRPAIGNPPSYASGTNIGATWTQTSSGTANYSGTCWTADTTTYRQNYSGTVYGATTTTTTYYFAYTVTVDYTELQPPTAPTITYPTAGVVLSNPLGDTITWNAGTDVESPASKLLYNIELSLDNGSTWNLLAKTVAGATSYLYNFTQNSATTQAKLRIVTIDESNMSSGYAYSPIFTITQKVKLGEEYTITKSGKATLPIYDPTYGLNSRNQLRSDVHNKIGSFELVPITDPSASPLRVMTANGMKAVAKL